MKRYQTIVDILNEIFVPELKKIFIDSNIYTEIKLFDVYDNESQHCNLVIDGPS